MSHTTPHERLALPGQGGRNDLHISMTMVGRNLFPCLFSKKCLAAAVKTGFSVSTNSLILSEKGAMSFFTNLKGSTAVR